MTPRKIIVTHTIVNERLAEPGDPNTGPQPSDQPAVEDMRLLLVAPDDADALWAAVWALEDSLSALQRHDGVTSPRPYVLDAISRIQRNLYLLRDLLATL